MLIENIDKLHTTPMGVERIRQNLSLKTNDVVGWCRTKILEEKTVIDKQGKNWYAKTEDCVITINSHSYTIITAHKHQQNGGVRE